MSDGGVPMTAEVPREALTEADTARAVATLNKGYAWVERYGQVYRFKFSDFVAPAIFRITHGNVPALLRIDGELKRTTLGDAWLRSPVRRQHRDVVYEPGEALIFDDSVNLWCGWGCHPVAGDIEPWKKLLDFVFGEDMVSRSWFESWAAYPVQYPGAKLNCAVVIWSARQGVGKTLIGETIGTIYGRDNFQTISAAELHGAFNGWAKRCQFVLGEENASSDHRADSNRLKHMITGDTIQVNEKYQPAIALKNRLNFLFTSNHPDAFFLETFDRRFFVWEIPAERLPDEFYADFVDWRDNRGGSEALFDHFRTLDLSEFNPKAAAPMTKAKQEMIDTSRSDLERWLCELRDDCELAVTLLGREIVTLDDLVVTYNRRGGAKVNTTSVGKALHRLGNRDKRRIKLKGGRPHLVSVCRSDHWTEQDNTAWAAEHEGTSRVVLEERVV
jgi:Family of unknown function (DUF5906)